MVSPELLKILCCPETHQSLREAAPDLVARLNQQIISGQLKNRGGKTVTGTLSGGLIRDDGKYLYPIREEIPIMLVDEALPLPPQG
jgi:uncharacterized protein YbaR (Trm112 family)